MQKYVHDERIKFETEVAAIIKQKYPQIRVWTNVESIKSVILPGEIDIICLYKGILVLIECKAAPLKFTIKEEVNFESNFVKDTKKSFISKMRKKVCFIQENIEELKKELDITEISDIRGMFVLKYPSAVLDLDDMDFPVVHISMIEKFFEGLNIEREIQVKKNPIS